jgi:hypothetical protein
VEQEWSADIVYKVGQRNWNVQFISFLSIDSPDGYHYLMNAKVYVDDVLCGVLPNFTE